MRIMDQLTNLWQRLLQWLDKKMKEKAAKGGCCNKPGKGKSSCC